jgi:hypothetical protein
MAEKVTWPDMLWPTPEQWLEWFESLTPERKLEVATVVCANNQAAARCNDQAHLIRLADYRDAMLEVRGQLGNLQDQLDYPISDDAGEGLPASQSAPESLPGVNGNHSQARNRALASEVLHDWGHGHD